MPKFDDPTPKEIRDLISKRIQETLEDNNQDFNKLVGLDRLKIVELENKIDILEIKEAFELTWFDNVAVMNEVDKEVAFEWFKLGYEANKK